MSKKKEEGHNKEDKAKKPKAMNAKGHKKSILKDAPEENCFILCNGQRVKNVKELADALEVLGDDIFNHHVTFERNDFSSWINDVFKDEELAIALAGIKDKKDTRIVIYKYIIKNLGV